MSINIQELKGKCILYVEETKEIRDEMILLFDKLYLSTHIATNGAQGFELFKKYIDEIDIIITSVDMPVITGLQMAKRIHQIDKYIPIIFTIDSSEEYVLEDTLSNVDRCVIRPIDKKDLTATIILCIRKYNQNKQLYKKAKKLATEVINSKKNFEELKIENETLQKELSFYKFLSQYFIASVKLDNSGHIQEISNQFSIIYQYTLRELQGKPINFICENSGNVQKHMLEAIKSSEAVGFTETFISADREKMTFHNIVYPLYENKNQYLSGYMIYQSFER